jgi:hypothetical protein
MNVYVIVNRTNGLPVEVSARPWPDIRQAYGAPEWGTKEIQDTAQGARFIREHEVLEAVMMKVSE